MRIGIINDIGFKQLHGGNLRVFFLIKELLRRGHEITIIHGSDDDAKDSSIRFGCRTLSIGASISRWKSSRNKLVSYSSFALRARQVLKKLDVDAFFGVNLIHALPIVNQKHAKSVILYVDLWSDFYEYDQQGELLCYPISKITRFMEEQTIRKADQVMMITKTMKSMVRKPYSDKIVVVPDGADTEMFAQSVDSTAIKREYGIADEPIIGYQGGIAPHEGLQFLAKAAPLILKKVPEARFLIAGSGSYLDTVQNIVKENNTEKSFIFTGWIDYSRMPEILAATDVSVVPMPNVPATRAIISFKLLEGLASCTPLVVNDLPGVREIVNDSMVRFTNAEEPARFSEDIVEVLNYDEEKRKQIVNRGRKRVEKLDWRKIAIVDTDFIEGNSIDNQVTKMLEWADEEI